MGADRKDSFEFDLLFAIFILKQIRPGAVLPLTPVIYYLIRCLW